MTLFVPRYLILGTSALAFLTAVALKFPFARADEGQNLADVFLRTCAAHIDDVSQLSYLVRAEGAQQVETPDAGVFSVVAAGETWILRSALPPITLHFKNGERDGRHFALCLLRQDTDVFNASIDGVGRAITLRRVPSKADEFMRRTSFMVADSPALVDISTSQGPLTSFTLISMTKLLGERPR